MVMMVIMMAMMMMTRIVTMTMMKTEEPPYWPIRKQTQMQGFLKKNKNRHDPRSVNEMVQYESIIIFNPSTNI